MSTSTDTSESHQLDRDDDVPKKKSGRAGLIGWLLLFLVLGLGGWGGWMMHERLGASEAALARARAALTEQTNRAHDASTRAAEAEGRARALAEERDRLIAERDRLAEEAAGLRSQVAASAEQQQAIEDRLRTAVADAGELHRTEGGRVTLQLVDRVLFPLGEAELTPAGTQVLDRVAEALNAFPDQQIWVEGHTDTAPVRDTTHFASNWELSTLRAACVVHYLQDHASIDPKRLAIVGFGEYRPIAPHTPARNRRIEIVLFPQDVRVGAVHH
jgi:chemotaxis protein MotB